MASAALTIAILVATSIAFASDDYIRGMPSNDAVRAVIKGSDPGDTAARRSATFYILKQTLYDLSEGRSLSNTLTPREAAALKLYSEGESASNREGAAGPVWFQKKERYHYDTSLKDEIADKLLSPSVAKEHDRALAARRAEPSLSGVPSSSSGRDVLAGFALIIVVGLGTLAFPVFALVRTRRLALKTVTGIVTGAQTSIESRLQQWSGTYDPQARVYRGGGAYTSTSRNQEFFLHDGRQQRAVTIYNTPFGVREGHRVTVAWAFRSAKAEYGYFCRAYNHETRQGAESMLGVRHARGSGVKAFVVLFGLLAFVGYWVSDALFPSSIAAEARLVQLLAVAGGAGAVLMGLVYAVADRRTLVRARAIGRASRA